MHVEGGMKVGGNFTAYTNISFTADTVIIKSPSSRSPRSVQSEPSLTWFPLADAFEESGPNLFSLLRWDFRLVRTLYGREAELWNILTWARGGSNTPTARLITGEGGVGKTRLAATAAETLRHEGWSAGFLATTSDLVGMKVGPKGLFLVLDYPEEQPERTAALLAKLAELKTAPYPLRVVFLSRRSFAEWEREAAILKGRFGRQELAAPRPLSIEDGVRLIEEAARNFAEDAKKHLPDLRGATTWLAASPRHRLPLYAQAAAIHAVLTPRDAFGLAGAELLKQLALRELERVKRTSVSLGLGDQGLECLLALGVLADGLSEGAIEELTKSGLCARPASDIIASLARSPWWRAGRLIRLEPDAPAAAFLDWALFGSGFPKGPSSPVRLDVRSPSRKRGDVRKSSWSNFV